MHISSYSWFCKNSCVYPSKKRREKINENTNLFTHIILTFPKAIYLTFSFSKYHLLAATHASILSIYFLWWSHTPLECVLRWFWVSWITWVSVWKFWPHSSHFNTGNNQNLKNFFQQSDRSFNKSLQVERVTSTGKRDKLNQERNNNQLTDT